MPKEYWLHVEDFVGGIIGPFDTPHAALAHYDWTKQVRGDGATFIAIYNEKPDISDKVCTTPENDKEVTT